MNEIKFEVLPSNSPWVLLSRQRKHLKYGIIFHKILEDAVRIRDLHSILQHPLIQTLDDEMKNKFYHSAELICSNSWFSNIITESIDLKTEVDIGYIDFNGNIVIGRIDLLIFAHNKVLIVDYKSDYYIDDSKYLDQLNLYASGLQKIYKDKELLSNSIEAGILWLSTGEWRKYI
jgi:ATP-dependent exoDNAse (exonuclease V) beta subunit